MNWVGLPDFINEFHCLFLDTFQHSWEVLAEIMKSDDVKDLLCDIGMYNNNNLKSFIIVLGRSYIVDRDTIAEFLFGMEKFY